MTTTLAPGAPAPAPARRRTAAVVAGAALVAGGIVAGILLPVPGQPTRLDVTFRATSQVPVDVGPGGHSPGDAVVFVNAVLDASGAVIGSVGGQCVQYGPDPARYDCAADLTLRDGTLSLHGLFDITAPTNRLAVTGGTGIYAGAHGEGTAANGDVVGTAPDDTVTLTFSR